MIRITVFCKQFAKNYHHRYFVHLPGTVHQVDPLCKRFTSQNHGYHPHVFSNKHSKIPTIKPPWLCNYVSTSVLCLQNTNTPPDNGDSTKKSPVDDPNVRTTVKVKAVKRPSVPRAKTDFSKSYTANIYITPVRAMEEYLINSGDLDGLSTTKRRSPYPERDDITVYLRRDVERKALEKWGSMDALLTEKKRLDRLYKKHNTHMFSLKKAKRYYLSEHEEESDEKPYIFSPMGRTRESIFKTGPGRVVLYAIAINGANCVCKLLALLYTGSHSMFSEMLHSLADTANQVILAVGIHQSLRQPDTEHPYGWSNFRNVSSLISGVGIFCVGAGLSWYHGIVGLLNPEEITSLFWALCILGGSLLSEGATLMVAFNEIRSSARKENMTFINYMWHGMDPSTNVVLLEDAAAVLGVIIAGSCMGLTYYTGNPIPDAIGSLLIGSLLGGVASFIIYTNTIALVGRSMPQDKKQQLMMTLENDRMIRALHDVKATDMGSNHIRFKAEVDFDGREITRYYLDKMDMDVLMKEYNTIKTPEELEEFMLKHGEKIVDTLGSQVDRIEKNIKRKYPQIRHVDLEQL